MDPVVDVRSLDGMIGASFWGFGEDPESKAWAKLKAWAVPKGLDGDHAKHPIYGFDNPRPPQYSFDKTTKNRVYGYEYIMRIDERCEPAEDMRIVELRGGTYAVSHMPDFSQHGQIWTYLMNWPQDHGYQLDPLRPWLEQHLGENDTGGTLSMDLFLPIVPATKK